MAKQYQVTQKVTINGVYSSVPFSFYGDESDLTAFCALLEGGYEVKEIVAALSDTTASDTNKPTSNPVSAIYMSGSKNQMASIRPYSGSLHFKNTTSVDDIAQVLKTVTPFELLPTEKPLRVTVKRNESFSASEPVV